MNQSFIFFLKPIRLAESHLKNVYSVVMDWSFIFERNLVNTVVVIKVLLCITRLLLNDDSNMVYLLTVSSSGLSRFTVAKNKNRLFLEALLFGHGSFRK